MPYFVVKVYSMMLLLNLASSGEPLFNLTYSYWFRRCHGTANNQFLYLASHLFSLFLEIFTESALTTSGSGSVVVTAYDFESGRPGSNPEWGLIYY